MKTPPNKFSVTITEEDRQTAAEFSSTRNCLIATALKREGYEEVLVDPREVDIGNEVFKILDDGGRSNNLDTKDEHPYYGPAVVGKVIEFERIS